MILRLLLALWILGILGLSHFSGYEIRAVGSMNFDIATMLTPWGFLRNFWLEPESYLRPYYFQTTQARPELWSNAGAIVGWLVLLTASLGLLRSLSRRAD